MASRAEVCVLLPTLDEAATVGDVIESFQAAGFSNILVIDGGSTDNTRELARESGATVMTQSGSGKGQAVREAVAHIESPYVLMADADMTYDAGEADRLLEPLFAGEADHVIGNRFASMESGSMTTFNKLGNRIFNRFFSLIYGVSYTDILSGYRAFTTDSFDRLTLSADGFGIETELSIQCAKHDIETAVVPITYRPRPDGSATNLHPIVDGSVIFMELYRNAKTNNPLFYFGSVGLLSAGSGLLVGVFVVYRWLTVGTTHELLALASVASVLLGVQLLIFGFLADMVQSLHREHRDHINRLEAELVEQPDGNMADSASTADGSTLSTPSEEADDDTTTQSQSAESER